MKISVLGSGSKGNSVFIESGGTALLIDNGFSGKEVSARLERIGCSADSLGAICVTHEHNDHIAGVGVLSRRYGIPVHANSGTFRASEKKLGKLYKRCEFETGERFEVGAFEVHSFPISHDTADPVGFVISDGHFRVGYCTDTGKVSHLMTKRLADCNGLILEFNHDPDMLKNGPYPLPLQQRVRSSRGHLSNEDAGRFLVSILSEQTELVIQAHLSETNNTADLAVAAANQSVLDWAGVRRIVAKQSQPTELFCFGRKMGVEPLS